MVKYNALSKETTDSRMIGFAFVFMISPLAADLTTAAICIERSRPGVFGKSVAYAQVYALFTCAIVLGVLSGPVWVSLDYEPLSGNERYSESVF